MMPKLTAREMRIKGSRLNSMLYSKASNLRTLWVLVLPFVVADLSLQPVQPKLFPLFESLELRIAG